MTETLRLLVAPLAALAATIWAALLALAAEAEGDEGGRLEAEAIATPGGGRVALSRALHVAHLALLVLAGTAAGAVTAWWTWSPLPGLLRLSAAVGFVWVCADLLPRILGALAPELPIAVRGLAVRTLRPFSPLLRLIAWGDARVTPVAPGSPAAQRTGRDVAYGVFTLHEAVIADVMTPRIDIVAVDLADQWDEVVTTLRRSEHARLLVFDGHPDAVVGVLYAKDMLALMADASAPREWHALIRPVPFVPEAKRLDRQLRDFQRGGGHLAVVVDEFGGTAGLVTLEDILEQVVGEIQDERDTDEVAPIRGIGEDAWRVQGGAALAELEAAIGVGLEREDISTVGGLVLAEFGRVPRVGESVPVGPLVFRVEQMRRRRVTRVEVRRRSEVVADVTPAEAEAT